MILENKDNKGNKGKMIRGQNILALDLNSPVRQSSLLEDYQNPFGNSSPVRNNNYISTQPLWMLKKDANLAKVLTPKHSKRPKGRNKGK
jgi:hypothetical protein